MAFTPHTPEDIARMLAAIGESDIEHLFDEIPLSLRAQPLAVVPEAQNEMQMLREAQTLSQQNRALTCFIGAGSYEHHIPAAVWDITMRGEYLTAYTPYQAEASQGGLQLLYEFQTMIAELTGMDVANASMYDGATALAEAILMAVRLNKRSKSHKILLPASLHPFYRETVETIVRNQHIELLSLPFDATSGITDLGALQRYAGEDISAIVIAQPNFFGALEAVDVLSDWARERQIISIACVNPVALACLQAPGHWGRAGVDIVCGEGQPLGVPMAAGGPYFGFLSCKKAHVRQLPGRLVGRTLDRAGKEGYTLTLQAREQHIRRAKATSNICTNQGLLVTAATIHMSMMGAEGLAQVAALCHHNTCCLLENLLSIAGVRQRFDAPFFHEIVIELPRPVSGVLRQLAAQGIAGGYALEAHYPELANCLLVCATEMRTEAEIEHYCRTLSRILLEA
ncbi:MAG: aminomethyl-transferring glycine dehydrogenase subunit GcvPA [Legionellaceae bacterium]|nr:aminomethyl-transferring glycine dehydrogenase subunit GcvPA [Legionellaceae bacterium]